jgi:hypothetical protein
MLQNLPLPARAYPKVEHPKVLHPAGSGPTHKHWAKLEKFARDKCSSLLQIICNFVKGLKHRPTRSIL